MKKLIVLLWVVFLPITSMVAQSNEEKQEVYDQLKEWTVVKLTIAYMEDLYLFTPEVKGSKGSVKEYNTYKILTDDYQDYSNEKEINLEDVGQLLKDEGWPTTKKRVFDSYKALDINSENNFNKIQASGYTEGMSKQNFNSTRTVLNEKFEELLKDKNVVDEEQELEKSTEEDKIEDSKVESVNKSPIEETRERNSNSSFWFYGILSMLIVAVIIVLLLMYKNKNLKNSLKKAIRASDKHNSDQGLFSPTAEKLRSEIQTLKITEDRYKREADGLKKEIEKLKTHSTSALVHTTTKTIIDTPTQSINLEVPQQNPSNLIYLSSPFQNLTFANEDASKEKASNSLYLVEFNEQMQSGELSVLVDADLSKALNSPDTYLETACTYDNEYFNNARAIKVTEKGEIKLEGEDWTVTKKVRIKFI